MDHDQAKRFGERLHAARVEAGLSLRQLTEKTGIDNGMLSRLESGQIMAPGPDKLARLAAALDVPLADLFAAADYVVPNDLPSPGPYLRAKFRDLPAKDMAALEGKVAELLIRYGVDPDDQPAPGEDETPAQPRKKKGGKS